MGTVNCQSPTHNGACSGVISASTEELPDIANMGPYNLSNHPVINVSQPHPHDVLFGRGGGTNHHPGNKVYRKMVEDRKPAYIRATRKGKPQLAFEIIQWVRYEQDPPGRFLKYDNGGWRDVGDKNARVKTSQALREKASNCPKGFMEDTSDNKASTEEEGLSTTQPCSSLDETESSYTKMDGQDEEEEEQEEEKKSCATSLNAMDHGAEAIEISNTFEMPPPLPEPSDADHFATLGDFDSFLNSSGISLNEQTEMARTMAGSGEDVVAYAATSEWESKGSDHYTARTHDIDDIFNSFVPPSGDVSCPKLKPSSDSAHNTPNDQEGGSLGLSMSQPERVGSNPSGKFDERFNSLYDIDNPLPYAAPSADEWNIRDSFEHDPALVPSQGDDEEGAIIFGPERLHLDKRATSHNNETSETRRKGCKLIRCPLNGAMGVCDPQFENTKLEPSLMPQPQHKASSEQPAFWFGAFDGAPPSDNDAANQRLEGLCDSAAHQEENIQFKSAPMHFMHPSNIAPASINFMARQKDQQPCQISYDRFSSRRFPQMYHQQWSNNQNKTTSPSMSLQSLRLSSRGLSDGLSTTEEEMSASFRNISLDPATASKEVELEHKDRLLPLDNATRGSRFAERTKSQQRRGSTETARQLKLVSLKEPSLSSFMSLELSTSSIARADGSQTQERRKSVTKDDSSETNALDNERESTVQTVGSGILTDGDSDLANGDNPSLSTFNISASIFDLPDNT